jgi:hypothetical protein
LDEPPWKSAKGRCVARNQINHSPKPMSVGQVCVKTSKGYHVKSIVSYECVGNVLEAVFSLAVYVSYFFFLEFSLIRVLDWLITLSWVVAGGEVRDKQGHSKRFRAQQ